MGCSSRLHVESPTFPDVSVAAVCLAALSAAGFAVSTPLQHHANTAVREDPQSTGGFGALVRRPWWVLGQVMAMVAFTLHAVALHLGALILVQPIVVSGIVLAVPVRAALGRRPPRRGELTTVAVTAAGLAMFLVAARPGASQFTVVPAALGTTAAGAALAAAAAFWAGRRRGVPRASGYGLACGVLFGVTGGLVKLAATHVAEGHGPAGHVWALLSAWPAWAVVLTGLSGVVLNQRAYRAAPLSASMPLLNIVDVVVAIGFGLLVFGEVPAHSPSALLGEAVALGLMLVGLRRLAREEDDGSADAPRPARVESRT